MEMFDKVDLKTPKKGVEISFKFKEEIDEIQNQQFIDDPYSVDEGVEDSRIEGFNTDEWCYIGIVCTAEITFYHGEYSHTTEFGDTALWGINSDASLEYKEEVKRELRNELEQELEMLKNWTGPV